MACSTLSLLPKSSAALVAVLAAAAPAIAANIHVADGGRSTPPPSLSCAQAHRPVLKFTLRCACPGNTLSLRINRNINPQRLSSPTVAARPCKGIGRAHAPSPYVVSREAFAGTA